MTGGSGTPLELDGIEPADGGSQQTSVKRCPDWRRLGEFFVEKEALGQAWSRPSSRVILAFMDLSCETSELI